MGVPLRVLILEDRQTDAELIAHELRRAGFEPDWTRVETESDYLAHLNPAPDVILADYSLPQFDGQRALHLLQKRGLDIPFIVVTGAIGDEAAVECMKQGAADYLLKDRLARLGQAVTRALEQKQLRDEKRQAEARYRSLFERVPVGLYRSTPQGQIVDVNPALVQMLGYSDRQALLAVNAADLYVNSEERRRWQALTEHDEIVCNFEAQFRQRDGSIIWVDDNVRTVRDADGRVLYYEGSLKDITERVQRERELEAIVTVATVLRAAPTRADMLPLILDQLLDLLNAEGAALAMRDPASAETVVELGRGEWTYWTGKRLPAGEGVGGQVIATGQPYMNNDMQVHPLLGRPDPSASSGQALVDDLHAVACVPLIAQEQTVGALWVGRKADIGDGELRLLTAIADMAANAIHRAALYAQTERRLQRLVALRDIDQAITASLDLRVTLNVLLDQVTTQLGIHAADVLLLNPNTQRLECIARRGFRTAALQHTRLRLGEGSAGRAALERRLISIPNLAEAPGDLWRAPLLADEGFITYYAAPLIVKSQVKGVLEIFHRAPLDPDPEWLDFLETLAGQAAIAVDNASLFNDLQRSNAELALAYDTTLEGWAKALELRDRETEGHTRRVTEMTLRLARAMGMSEAGLVHVRRGALLHDIGKMGIPDSILHKPGPLTEEEWEIMWRHPVYAYKLLSPIAYLRPALDIPYCHHEKWDGTGYPRGLKGAQIPLAARIFTVADVWDAVLSDRPYRPAWPEEKACAYIREQTGKHFDPQVVQLFMTHWMDGLAGGLAGLTTTMVSDNNLTS